MTPGGVRVRNVAQPVIRAAYRVYELHPSARAAVPAGVGSSPASAQRPHDHQEM